VGDYDVVILKARGVDSLQVTYTSERLFAIGSHVQGVLGPAWTSHVHRVRQKKGFNLPLSMTKDFTLWYSTELMKEPSLGMKELAFALRLSFSGSGVSTCLVVPSACWARSAILMR
jgi:hypothetical protein